MGNSPDLNGQRRRRKRSHLEAAKAEAQRIADDIAGGRPSSELNQSQIASFKAGVHNLRWTGKSIEVVTSDVAEAVGQLRAAGITEDPAMVDLARFFVRHRPTTVIDLTTSSRRSPDRKSCC